ncbi:MAG: sulfatase [Candidatus Eisenbacteria bacterium]
MTALTILGTLLIVAANAADPLLFRGRRPEGPNVLLVSLDNLRADGLGCYGAERPTSPAIDAFARECVLFENAHSQSPYTLPSHASFLSSRYPSVNHASIRGNRLPAARVLGTELFREAGYRTFGIVDTPFLTDRYGLEQGYDHFVGWGRGGAHIVPAARSRLEKTVGTPFFFFVHIYDIHAPYAKDPEYRKMFLDFDYGGSVSSEGHVLARWQKMKKEGEDPGFEIAEEDGRYLEALYDGGIRSTDDLLVGLLDDISKGPLGENTIVIITADHGEEFLEHGQVLHDDLYRTLTHVPLLIRLPGGVRGGTRIPDPVGLIDLLPTLIDLTGIPAPVRLDGRSLVPLIEGGERPDRPVFGEMPRGGGRVAVVRGRWHLVGHPDGERWELYRYGEDPFEQVDLSADRPELVDSLRAILDGWLLDLQAQKFEEPHLKAKAADVDEETRERLRALGYLDE